MSNPRDLVQERRLIAARRTRRTAVTVEIAAWRDNHHPGDVVKGVQVRCDDCANGHPLIAKLYPTPSSLLFVARIRWRPVDQLTLPPWTKDRMLADADDLLVGDDRILGGWLDHLDAWTTGLQADGDRWLVAEPDFKLYDVIDRPADDGWMPELWTRCRAGHSRVLDRVEMLEWGRRVNALPT